MGQGFQLVFRGAEGLVVRQFDQDRVLLGRSLVCDVVFDSPHLSRKHVEILRDPDGWILQDLRSRLGVAVNGQRIGRQRLADGDRIALAPDAAESTLVEFRLPESAGRAPPQGILSDATGPTSVVASIDLRELSDALSQSGQGKRPAIVLHAGDAAANRLTASDPSARAFFEGTSQLPVLSMFKSAGEILLADESLDAMLQRVANLIAEHLPGRRGAVCMVDQASGDIQPRCFSQEGSGEQGAGSGEQGAGSRGQGAKSREQGAGEQAAVPCLLRRALPAPRSPTRCAGAPPAPCLLDRF